MYYSLTAGHIQSWIISQAIAKEYRVIVPSNVKDWGGDVTNTTEEEYLHTNYVMQLSESGSYLKISASRYFMNHVFRSIGDIAAFVTYIDYEQ